jgi:HD-like signal output (HDOD) protein/CheY-like chemotaxis protein
MTPTRILFVDDEPLFLQRLEQVLRPQRSEWETEFVDSGAKALERMARAPFDVIVSDMLMPGMNGAELLAEVLKRHPKTIRLILSGHADKDLILKCVGSTHQYLAKPCDAEALKATVLRAAAAQNTFRDERLKELITRMDRLPSIPALYMQIVGALRKPDVTLEEVGWIISHDMAMTAKILKLVSSAFFGLGRQVTSPAEAAKFLGLDTIRSLVLSINAFSQFESFELGKFSIEALWTHSLITAATAKDIARAEGAGHKLADEAFIAGMLHDIGKLVLATNFAAQYNQALQLMWDENLEPFIAEQQVFGASHADVGSYLLGLWGLPVPVVEAIALHHWPNQAVQKQFSPLTAVHAANGIVREREAASGQGPASSIDPDYLAELGLSDRLEVWRQAAH